MVESNEPPVAASSFQTLEDRSVLIRNLSEAQSTPVEVSGADRCSMAVMVGKEDGAPNFAIRQIVVEPAGCTPRHSHDYEHEVVVLEGNGEVFFEGQERPIKPGDVVYVPAGQEHQFRATGKTPMRFLCVTPIHSACGQSIPGT